MVGNTVIIATCDMWAFDSVIAVTRDVLPVGGLVPAWQALLFRQEGRTVALKKISLADLLVRVRYHILQQSRIQKQITLTVLVALGN